MTQDEFNRLMKAYEDDESKTPLSFEKENLTGLNLSGLDFSGFNFRYANFFKANLAKSNFTNCDMTYATFMESIVSGADFTNANLTGCDFTRADLSDYIDESLGVISTNLTGATITDADFHDPTGPYETPTEFNPTKIHMPEVPNVCPATGEFTAYKKVYVINKNGEKATRIVKLTIPSDAARLSGTSRKCRADKAIVKEIQYLDGTRADETSATSYHDDTFIYEVYNTTPKTYQTITLKDSETFDTNRWNECGNGIHFFVNRNEAVAYNFQKQVPEIPDPIAPDVLIEEG